jgi:hypothetical protein
MTKMILILSNNNQGHETRMMTNMQQVQDTVDQLEAKYGSSYIQMQFRIWAELIVGGMYSIVGPPSNNSLFKRAGAGDGASKKNETHVTQTLTNVSTASLSAKDNQESQQSISSPVQTN